MHYFLGLDTGTTHGKALLVNREGKELGFFKKEIPSYQPHTGFHEQHAEEVFSIMLSLVSQALGILPDDHQPLNICFSHAMHSLLAMDKNGNPLSPVMTWADTRSRDFAAKWKDTPIGTEIYRQCGTPIHPMSPLCKIAWIREQHPLIFERTARFISLKEYFIFRMTGVYEVDFSIAAATGLFETRNLKWHEPALTLAGIKAEQLSVPVSCTHELPAIKEDILQILNANRPILLIAGASDGALANIGTGAIRETIAGLTIGTSAAVRIFRKQAFTDPGHQLFCYSFDENMYLSGGATNNGGNLLDWFSASFTGKELRPEEVVNLAEQSVPGANGIVFLPYVYGERAPVWDPAAIPVFSGVSCRHTISDRARAMLEGICFSMLQLIRAIELSGQPVQLVLASGGFTASAFWLQLMADILQKEIRVSEDADASARGACMVGMKARGIIRDWEEISAMIPDTKSYKPDPDPGKAELYRRHMEKYDQLYPFTRSLRPVGSVSL